jgi:6-phosphogluconolactonase
VFSSLIGDVGELSLSRDGASIYLPLSGFDLFVRLAIDENGLITIGENRPAPASPDQVSLHPDGSAAYVASTTTGETRRFPLDLNSGELGILGDSEDALLGELSDLRVGAAGRWMHIADVQAGEVGHVMVDQLTASLSLGSKARARLGAADSPVIIRGDTAAVSEPVALYVSCGASSSVEAYAVDPLTGALSFLQTTPTQAEPHDLVIGNADERLYLSNSGNNSISTFVLNSDNSLGIELGSLGLIAAPTSLALEPSGRFLYATVSIGKRVYGFEIQDDDGTLRALQGEGGGVGVNASSLAVDPTGRFLYCASKGEAPYNVTWENGGNPGVVTVLYIDAETGVPVPIDESVPGTILVPFRPDFVIFDPSGVRAYTNQTTSSVKVAVPLDVSHANGDGTIVVPGTATDDAPTAIEIGSSGRFAWVSTSDGLGGGELQLYDVAENGSLVNAAAGDFTPRAIYTEVSEPIAIKSDSNERFLYVLNKSTEVISTWQINASDGTLTKLSEIMTGTAPVAIHLNERF